MKIHSKRQKVLYCAGKEEDLVAISLLVKERDGPSYGFLHELVHNHADPSLSKNATVQFSPRLHVTMRIDFGF